MSLKEVIHTCSFMNPELDQKEGIIKLLDFLRDFDPIQLKYSPKEYKVFSADCCKDPRVPFDIRDEMIKYDSTYSVESINKESYSSIADNLGLVYGSSKVVENDVKIFNLTEKKIISRYLAIPQLTKMFDEDYFNFEWDMHVAQNFREHRNNYQRDHFIHQIRDMYSMMILLGEHGFYDACKKILGDRNLSKISLYTQMKLSEFMNSQKGINSRFERIRDGIFHYFYNDERGITTKYDKEELEEDTEKRKRNALEKYKETYFMKYVIYASSILSALFHDMGYPICHFLETRNRTSQYNPTMYMFVKNEVESFDHIASLLSSSLLFTVISRDEIKASMQIKPNNSFNHGAYSAIAFLMQFYNSGIIFSLPKEKQCAIELAAVAIYNHTLEYRISREKTTNFYYQPVFKQNPISFMLRLCDDLQEWNRRYFVVSEESDIPICKKCLTPSIFNRKNDMITYRCKCSANQASISESCDYNSFRYYNFYNRKLYLVSTSDYMTSYKMDLYNQDKTQIVKSALCFHVHYDYYRLLNVTRINSTYAKYRISELNDLKKLLGGQDYKNDLDFDFIYLDYFVTANPLTIKIKILEKYIEKCSLHIDTTTLDEIYDRLSKACFITNSKKLKLYSILKSNVKKQQKKHGDCSLFDFYKQLLLKAIELRKMYDVDYYKISETTDVFLNEWFSNIDSNYYKQIMKNLITETFEQYSKELNPQDSLKHFNEESFQNKYLNQYAPNKYSDNALYNSIRAYCNSENDFNCYSSNKIGKYISYFADLYFFEAMNKVLQVDYINKLALKDK